MEHVWISVDWHEDFWTDVSNHLLGIFGTGMTSGMDF